MNDDRLASPAVEPENARPSFPRSAKSFPGRLVVATNPALRPRTPDGAAASDASVSQENDNVLLRPVTNQRGERGPLVGHVVTVKEIWNLLPRASGQTADALLTVLTVQRWLTEPGDQRLAPDARRTEARQLAYRLAQHRCATRRDV
jgi:hypothetical protein